MIPSNTNNYHQQSDSCSYQTTPFHKDKMLQPTQTSEIHTINVVSIPKTNKKKVRENTNRKLKDIRNYISDSEKISSVSDSEINFIALLICLMGFSKENIFDMMCVVKKKCDEISDDNIETYLKSFIISFKFQLSKCCNAMHALKLEDLVRQDRSVYQVFAAMKFMKFLFLLYTEVPCNTDIKFHKSILKTFNIVEKSPSWNDEANNWFYLEWIKKQKPKISSKICSEVQNKSGNRSSWKPEILYYVFYMMKLNMKRGDEIITLSSSIPCKPAMRYLIKDSDI